uniref:DEAD-box ATP-dependent RNA helicase 42-like n=1 Tax=Erigeron canadensis TaxID=72917 RepID=UPI001CB8C8F8|nr:DEAD-box ATP-dependent RNA helicase 42-like [Erigeron canadensis]
MMIKLKAGAKILIFLKSHHADAFREDLLEHGYPSLLLPPAWLSNSSTDDIKNNICNQQLVIATPMHFARGLADFFQLVINYDDAASSCYYNYARKVRHAARNGCAVAFLSTQEERYAPHLVKALELTNQAVPDDLMALSDAFKARVHEIAKPLKPEFKSLYETYWLDFPPPPHAFA